MMVFSEFRRPNIHEQTRFDVITTVKVEEVMTSIVMCKGKYVIENIVLPARLVNICCFSTTERRGKELGGVIPYKGKSFDLIRTYSTHPPDISFCSVSNSKTCLSVA